VNSTDNYSRTWRSHIRQLAKSALAAALPRSMFITHGPRSARSACLTFDDGPDPEVTPRILDTLGQEGATAVFFVVGAKAERFPDIVRRIEAEGHMVGHHSYTHSPRSTWAVVQEARRSNEVLQSILGHSVRFYRPPRGRLRPLDFIGVWSLRQSIVLWNVDPKDFEQPSSDHLVEWFRARPLRGGDLVLLHDDELDTALALPSIIAEARGSALQLEALDRWTRWLPTGKP